MRNNHCTHGATLFACPQVPHLSFSLLPVHVGKGAVYIEWDHILGMQLLWPEEFKGRHSWKWVALFYAIKFQMVNLKRPEK